MSKLIDGTDRTQEYCNGIPPEEYFKMYVKKTIEVKALNKRIVQLEKCRMVLSHAVTLGYLGEGSTLGMAREALKESKIEGDVDEAET